MHSKRTLIFPLLLVFYEITTYLSNDMYLPALPQIANDIGISQSEAQLSLTAWFLGATSMQLVLGPLSDRYGRRAILLTSGLTFILSSVLSGFATDLTELLISRFVQGTAVCSVITAGYASIHELYDQRQAIRILAIMGSVVLIAPAFGPLFGSGVLLIANWRWIFWLIAILSALAIGLLFKFMPETNPVEKRVPLKIGILLKDYWKIFTNIRFLAIVFSVFLIFCGFIVWLAVAPFMMANQFGYGQEVFGLAQVIIFCFVITGNYLVRHYLEKTGLRRFIYIAMFTSLIGAIVMTWLAWIFPNALTSIVIGMSIYALGSGCIFPPLNRLAVEASEQPMGVRMAVVSSFMSGFGMLGSVLAGIFYDETLLSFAFIILSLAISACLIRVLSCKLLNA